MLTVFSFFPIVVHKGHAHCVRIHHHSINFFCFIIVIGTPRTYFGSVIKSYRTYGNKRATAIRAVIHFLYNIIIFPQRALNFQSLGLFALLLLFCYFPTNFPILHRKITCFSQFFGRHFFLEKSPAQKLILGVVGS